VLALAAVAPLGFYYIHAARAPGPPLTAVPFTTFGGNERHPYFSPDGSQVVFTWNGADQANYDIYVKVIGSESALRLTSDPAEDFSPVWSPDGRSIAFLRRVSSTSAAVMLIPPLGGAERKLAEVRTMLPEICGCAPSRSLSWSPDSARLAIMDKPSPEDPISLLVLSIETGEKRRLTRPPPGSVGDSDPAFSPDGRRLAFSRSTGFAVSDLYVISLTGALVPAAEPRRLTFDDRQAGNPTWTPDARQIIFSSNRSGGGDLLWKIRADEGAPERLESVGEDGQDPAISRQGDRLVYTRTFADANIWRAGLAPIASGGGAPAFETSPLVSSSRRDANGSFSPDGKRIAFASDRSGSFEIWVSGSDGANPVQLTRLRSFSGTPRWSPDGAEIAFDSNLEGHWEIYVANANGGARPRRLTTSPGDSAMPSWSRDGKWIYFASVRDGYAQVWKAPSAGGPPVQVTTTGGYLARESPDGRFVYYTKSDPYLSYAKNKQVDGLWRAPVDGGAETRVLETVKLRGFEVVEDGIYFFAPGPKSQTLVRFHNLRTNTESLIGVITKPLVVFLAISPDRRTLLYSPVDQQIGDLMLVEGLHW
jgi:Tol biopolymer transport system component